MKDIGEIKYHAVGYDDLSRRRHTHVGNHELLLCHSDGGSMLIGDSLYPLEKSTLFIINADYIHCSIPEDPARYERSVVMFNTNYICSVLAMLGITDMLGGLLPSRGGLRIALSDEDGRFVDECFGKMSECFDGASIYKRAVITHYIMTVLLRLSEGGFAGTAPGQGDSRMISRILAYISENIASDVSADRISAEIGISSSYLCRLFKRRTTMTLTRYVTEQRLALARSMLLQTDRTMLDIAMSCGFGSPSYFCRIFRENYGITPLEYRKSEIK